MSHFKEKVIWITGASSGIGEHLAYALAEEGAKLILSARNEKELSRVKNNCKNKTDILLQAFDITDFDAIPGIVKKVIDHFGFINIIINNAGISQTAAAKETNFAVDQRIMNVNFFGAVAMTKAALPYLLRQQFGHIVVMSSTETKAGAPDRSAYAASKYALHGYFTTLRNELNNHNIRVTIICPGQVNTNLAINALTGDGNKNNKNDAPWEKGMEPSVFAQKALHAIRAEKKVAHIGRREFRPAFAKRILPRGLFRK
jgi:short-subunit dehydrogenase